MRTGRWALALLITLMFIDSWMRHAEAKPITMTCSAAMSQEATASLVDFRIGSR
jgi:hypothetical protein